MTYGQAYILISISAVTLIWVPMLKILMNDKKEKR